MGTLSIVVVLRREVFDAIEFDAACSGDHRAAAQEMSRLADMGTQTQEMARSEAYVRAGEQWLLADEPAAAANKFQRALEDGGPASVDPRAPLARALFMLGRTDEADTLVGQLGRERPRDPRMCDLLAELFVDRSDLTRALAWATAGVELCLGRTPGPVAPGTPAVSLAGASGHPGPDLRSPDRPHDRAGTEPRTADRGGADRGGAEPGAGPGGPKSGSADPQVLGPIPGALRERTELRLLLTLRFRIRNDLGLPEDDYDRLLDQLPPEFAGPADAG